MLRPFVLECVRTFCPSLFDNDNLKAMEVQLRSTELYLDKKINKDISGTRRMMLSVEAAQWNFTFEHVILLPVCEQ